MSETPASPGRWSRIVGDVRGGAGPTLHCVGGIHGNEPKGLEAAERVIAKLWAAVGADPGVLRGRLVVIAGNLAALNDEDPDVRYYESDLNRMFRADLIGEARGLSAGERHPEQRELLELVEVLSGFAAEAPAGSAVLDLHTYSSESEPFVYVEDSLPARRVGLALGLPLVVGLEELLRGLMADWVTGELGLLSIVAEAGTHADPGSALNHEAIIWVGMETLGMIRSADELAGFDTRARLREAAGRQAGRFYDIRGRELVGEPPLEMLDRAQAFTRVWKGWTPVARRAGELVKAEADGILFMPNRQKVKRAGDDAFFVLRPIWRPLIGVSGWLRGRAWAHGFLARLPGIKRDGEDPHTLRVDHDVAAVMARDILHLFGYRVHSERPAAYRRVWTRAVLLLWVLPRALLRVLGVLPTVGDEIWVVRRRRLDVGGLGVGGVAERG